MSPRSRLCFAAFTMLALGTSAAVQGASAPDARIDREINGHWRFLRADAPGAEAPNFYDSKWEAVNLPHTWLPQQGDGHFYYYSGIVWYRYALAITPDLAGKQLFLRFGAASRVTDVFVNGELAGSHRGVFGAFCIDITRFAHSGQNTIAVRANNAFNKDIAPLSGDFTTYGGLFRGVHLLALNPISISPLDDAGPGVYLKTHVAADSANVAITTKLRNAAASDAAVQLDYTIVDAAGQPVVRATSAQTIPAGGVADNLQSMDVPHPHLWNARSDPYLYHVEVRVTRNGAVLDQVVQPLGLRYFKVDPNLGLFLNGKPYDLHGVNYHEGRLSVGFADTPEMEEEDNRLICGMGCTGVRMAHYQHNDYEYTLADRSGLIVWTELGLVNKMTDSPAFSQNIKQQLRELIKQEYNHPSVFFWSMYNEPWIDKDAGTQEQWQLVKELVSLAHQLDPGRLTTGAVVKGVDGPIDWYMDVTGVNRYDGWYDGGPEAWPKTLADLRVKYPDKAIGISEYGAGASIFQHQSPPVRPKPSSDWHPEEWQCIVHEHAWPAMQQQQWLWCKFIWCMFDFSSIGRHEGDTPGINDKGLVTADRKTCKDAYYYYKACWTKDPFVYIVDRRFDPRPPGKAQLRVYSNCDTVDLEVDGRLIARQTSKDHVFLWPDVSLRQGAAQVIAKGRKDNAVCTDTVSWHVFPDAVRPVAASGN
jgi:beta-galactosidase